MIEETVIMWTRQVPQVWDTLKTSGSYHVKREYIEMKNGTMSDYYLKLYEWYTIEARKQITISENLKYPIWLSLEEDSMLQPVEGTMILKVEIPKDKYVICNMAHWDYRVNYWYVPLDTNDETSHRTELKKYGIASDDELILTDKGNFYPLLLRKVKESWGRVLTVLPNDKRDAVATVWELEREWVKEVLCYEEGNE